MGVGVCRVDVGLSVVWSSVVHMAAGWVGSAEQIRQDLLVLRAALAQVKSRSWVQVGEAELVELVQLTEEVGRELFAVQIAQTDQLERRGTARAFGCTSTAVLLRQVCRVSVGEARSRVVVAAAVSPVAHSSGPDTDPPRPLLAAALAGGLVGAESAGLTARFLNTLPSGLDAEMVVLGERTMVEQAALGDPTSLRKVAQELAIRLDPDGTLPKDTRLGMTVEFGVRNHAGYTPVRAMLDDVTVERVRQAIEALSAPAAAVEGVSDQRSAANRRACALGEIAQIFMNTGTAPTHAGQHPNVTVYMSLDDLTGRIAPCGNCGHDPARVPAAVGVPESAGPCGGSGSGDKVGPHGPAGLHSRAGLLDRLGRHPPSTTFGGPISLADARRIACDARITPVVLGGKGEILDVGRSRYSFPAGIRKGLEARDRGCAFPGCDRPPGWTEAHHVHPFSTGGDTKLSSAVLVCDHHHHLLHHSDWQVRIAGDGIPEFLPPRWMDFQQRPRRNTRHG